MSHKASETTTYGTKVNISCMVELVARHEVPKQSQIEIASSPCRLWRQGSSQ